MPQDGSAADDVLGVNENFDYGEQGKKLLQHLTQEEVEEFILSRFTYERSMQANQRREREYDERLYHGHNFEDDELAIIAPQYQDLKTNILRRPVQYLINLAVRRKIKGRIYPAGGQFAPDEIKKIASAFDRRLQSVLTFCRFESALEKAIKDAAISGEGFLHESLVSNGDGRLKFKVDYVDWRDVWLDSHSIEPDLSDARHLFYIYKIDLLEARLMFPQYAEHFKKIAFDNQMKTSVDDEYEQGYYGSGYGSSMTQHHSLYNTGREDRSYYDEEERYERGRPTLNMGEAYLRMPHPETKQMQVYRMNFTMNESLSNVKLMTKTIRLQPFKHNMIPFSRIVYDMLKPTNVAYSPLVRLRRGYEKAITSLVRMALRLAGARGVVIDTQYLDQMPGMQNKSQAERIQYIRREMSKAVPVIAIPGGQNSVRMENLGVDIEKVGRVMEILMTLQETQAGISPELLGKASPSIAGVALAEKRDESYSNFSEFMGYMDGAVQGLCERLLSSFEQYAKLIEYNGVVGPAGEIEPMEDDKDASISGNRMKYHIQPESANQAMLREQANVLAASIQKMDPALSAQFMPIIMRMSGIPDSYKWERLMIEVLQMAGIKVAPGLLNEEEQEKAKEDAAAEQESQKEQQEMQKRGLTAQIEETESKAMKNLAQKQQMNADALKKIAEAFEIMLGGNEKEGDEITPEDARSAISILQGENEALLKKSS